MPRRHHEIGAGSNPCLQAVLGYEREEAEATFEVGAGACRNVAAKRD